MRVVEALGNASEKAGCLRWRRARDLRVVRDVGQEPVAVLAQDVEVPGARRDVAERLRKRNRRVAALGRHRARLLDEEKNSCADS